MSGKKIESSLALTVSAILLFFALSIAIVLISPRFIDASWMSPSSRYQVLLYEQLDPNLYISWSSGELEQVQHVVRGKTLFGYVESDKMKIDAADDLKAYITSSADPQVKLTSRYLMLRKSKTDETGDRYALYDPELDEGFVFTSLEGCMDNWVGKGGFTLLDTPSRPGEEDEGHLYVKNPVEYRFKDRFTPVGKKFSYDPDGKTVADVSELTGPLQFVSRQKLIAEGEQIYAREGCWYCHSDQTRTLVQDTVLNGSDSYPAPPSSANEYIYQEVTFPGTRRIGPDLSRVGVKRPSRAWHMSHFWAPKTISPGTIMPSFPHFFDEDPRVTPAEMGEPNGQFEAMYQYLMTKGTRITPPEEAWWLGNDPVKTKELIESVNPP